MINAYKLIYWIFNFLWYSQVRPSPWSLLATHQGFIFHEVCSTEFYFRWSIHDTNFKGAGMSVNPVGLWQNIAFSWSIWIHFLIQTTPTCTIWFSRNQTKCHEFPRDEAMRHEFSIALHHLHLHILHDFQRARKVAWISRGWGRWGQGQVPSNFRGVLHFHDQSTCVALFRSHPQPTGIVSVSKEWDRVWTNDFGRLQQFHNQFECNALFKLLPLNFTKIKLSSVLHFRRSLHMN